MDIRINTLLYWSKSSNTFSDCSFLTCCQGINVFSQSPQLTEDEVLDCPLNINSFKYKIMEVVLRKYSIENWNVVYLILRPLIGTS